MGARTSIEGWPVYWQLSGGDLLGRGAAANSPAPARQVPPTVTAGKVVNSGCPYCAAGCGQNMYASAVVPQRQRRDGNGAASPETG